MSRFEDAHVDDLEPAALRRSLSACVVALVGEGEETRLPNARVVAERLAELR